MTNGELKILFDKHYTTMMYVAMSRIHDKQVCQEIISDVFIVYYNKGYDIEHTLYTLLNRRIINYKRSPIRRLRQTAHWHNDEDGFELFDVVGEEYDFDFDNKIIEAKFIQTMYEKIKTLSAKDQLYIKELFFNNKTSAQFAREHGLPEASVRSEKRAVIDRLRTAIHGNRYIHKKRQQKLPSSRKP